MELPDRPALPGVLDIEPEFRDEFDRDLTELTATLRMLVRQYQEVRLPRMIDVPTGNGDSITTVVGATTSDRATAHMAGAFDAMFKRGDLTVETLNRLLAVAVRQIEKLGGMTL